MYDVAIIGAGPAGASAALFAAKSGVKTVMFDSGKSITAKAWVENHYGVKRNRRSFSTSDRSRTSD